MSGVLAHIRTRMTSGILLILPLVITLWLLKLLFSLVDDNVTPWVLRVLRASEIETVSDLSVAYLAPVVGLTLTLLLVYLFGLLAGNLPGRRLWSWVESGILRIPLVKGVYGSARQLLDSFSAGSGGGFSRVVAIEFPRAGVWTVGFVTNENAAILRPGTGDDRSVTVFLPTTPNPTSGWLAIVPARDVRPIDLSVEEGIKLIVSGGIVLPHRNPDEPRPTAPERRERV